MREKIILLFSGLFLFACNDNLNSIVEDNPPNLRELNAQEELMIESSNDFVFDLFHEINEAEQDKDFFFSPLSVEYALGMTLNGADKATLEAIKNCTSFGAAGNRNQQAICIPHQGKTFRHDIVCREIAGPTIKSRRP